MKRSVLSILMAFVISLTLLSSTALAAGVTVKAPEGKIITSQTNYTLMEGVTETQFFWNTSSGNEQVAGFMVTVEPTAKATYKASYTNYYTAGSTAASRKTAGVSAWGLQKTTEQAAAYEAATGDKVIMATNADYFNMQTGMPTGYLIMEGNTIKTGNEPYFALLKNGDYVIRDQGVDHSDVVEAISGPFYLVQNGANVSDRNDTYRAPRNCIGLKADGTAVTVLIDGRQTPYSVGCSYTELADFLIAQGVQTALYLDGGGSAVMASVHEGTSKLTIQSSPSDGVERSDSSTLLLVSTATQSTEFDHASVSTDSLSYTPGSTVSFKAIGVSSSGAPAELPTSGLTWSLAEESVDKGTIDQNGVFTSNGTCGSVTAVLSYNGVEVGSAEINIVEPDEIYFEAGSLSLDFGERSNLGFIVRANMSEIQFKDDDFVWNVGELGTMDGNTFVAGDVTQNGKLTVSYTRSDGEILTASVDVEIGKLPIVAFDFEPYKVETDGLLTSVRQLAAHYHWGKSTYVDNGTTKGYEGTVSPITVITNNTWADNPTFNSLSAPYRFTCNWDGAVPASDIFRANGYTYYLWPNNSITTYNVGTLSTVTENDGGQVRFGDYSLELNYDFRSFDNSSNSNWYIRYAGNASVGYPNREDYASDDDFNAAVLAVAQASAYTIEGTPKSLGVWVYADEQSAGFFLYADVMAWNGSDYSTKNIKLEHTGIDGTSTNKIDWTGWKYLTGDMSTLAQYVTTEHPLRIIPGAGLFWFSYQPGGGSGNRGAGTIYFDNYRFVYGADNDDLDNPEITGISVNGTALTASTTPTINTAAVEITANFKDANGANVSGIDAQSTVIKIDGETVGLDGDESQALTRLELANGLHSVQVTVYDGFGNYSTETRYFNVDVPESTIATAQLVGLETVTMGSSYDLNLVVTGDVKKVEMTVQQVNADFGEPKITWADGWDGEVKYESTGFKRAKMTITAEKKTSLFSLLSGSEASILTLSFTVPSTLDKEIDFFTYQVSGVTCTLSGGSTTTAAQPKVSLGLSAYYTVDAAVAVAGFDTTLTVYDVDGNPASGVTVSVDGAEIGTTNDNGQISTDVSKTLTAGNTFTVTASDADGRVSFEKTVTVMAVSAATAPVGVTAVASSDGAREQTISWFASSATAAKKAVVKYSTSDNMEDAVTVEGTSTLQAFATSKESALINSVKITGLEPGQTYYYMVGDGSDEEANWSAVSTFKTTAKGETTKFFVLGDTQMSGSETSDAGEIALLQQIASGVAGYDFGIQTGDYVDNGGNYAMWEELQNVFGTSFSGIDMIHTMGNHEYFGDSDGDAAALIYNLQGSDRDYYSVTYGNVYVAVINLNANLTDALAWLVEDAAKSDAAWKVLSVHQPAYYTNVNGGSAKYHQLIPAAADEAGINVVFSGHDHSYARTEPMTGGVVDTNNGTTYFICGDLGEKSRNINYKVVETEAFNFALTSQDYSALYLDITASDDTMTIVARDANGDQIDNVTIKAECHEGHSFAYYDSTSGKLYCSGCKKYYAPAEVAYTGFITVDNTEKQMYFSGGKLQTGWFDVDNVEYHAQDDGIVCNANISDGYYENGKIVCTTCNNSYDPAEIQYTGFITVKDTEKQMYFLGGNLKTGWFIVGLDEYHALADGIACKAEVRSSRTCTTGGYNYYYCSDCNLEERIGSYLYPEGHAWATDEGGNYLLNENGHRYCSVCNQEGIPLSEVTFGFGTVDSPYISASTPQYNYKGTTVYPQNYAVYNGVELSKSSSNNLENGKMKDLLYTLTNSTKVGKASIHFEGKGDYYGEASLNYIIIPQTVSGAVLSAYDSTSATLKWSASGGAGYYGVYTCNADGTNPKFVGNVTGTSYTISGLDADVTYYYKVRAKADVDGTTYYSARYSNVVTISKESAGGSEEEPSASAIKSITATVNGQQISAQSVDGKTYLFLPAAADLTALKLTITADGESAITLSGSKGTAAYADTADVTAIANAADSVYEVAILLGGEKAETVNIMQSANISAMYITSDDATTAGRSYVEAAKENIATATMQMTSASGTEIYSGTLSQVKSRGNSTFTYYDKKSYQIKLDSKSDLLGQGEKVKTWVLLAAYGDATKLHDKIVKDFAAELGMDYVASSDWVDLYYDGEYRGIYLLGEKNSIGSTGVNITDLEDVYSGLNDGYGSDVTTDTATNKYGQTYQYTINLTDPDNITGGYLLELNGNGFDEISGFYTAHEMAFNVKSPEWASREAMEYISEYYQEFEDAVYATDADGNYTGYNEATGKYYYDYCDRDSLIKAVLLQEFARNNDGFYSSTYFYKDVDGIMYCGPVWDQEMTFGTGWDKHMKSDSESYHYLEDALLKIPDFREALEKYYTNTFEPAASDLLGRSGVIQQSANKISDSVAMDSVMWPFVYIGSPENDNHLWKDGTTYADVIADMQTWTAERIDVLDSRFAVDDPASYVAKIGEKGYSRLQKAVNAVNDGGTITVLANDLSAKVSGDKTFTVVLADGVESVLLDAADGYILTANGDGTYTVKSDGSTETPSYVANNGNNNGSGSGSGGGGGGSFGGGGGSSAANTNTNTAANTTVVDTNNNTASPYIPSVTFNDVSTEAYYSDAVGWAVASGITNGTDPGVFSPEEACTRSQVVVFLWRAAGSPVTDASTAFSDVKSDAYYYQALQWAVANGITNGTSDTTFEPDGVVTRAQVVSFLYRAEKASVEAHSSFSDVAADAYYAEAVSWALQNNITTGTDPGIFSPEETCTRAQIVTFLYRTYAE